MTPDELRKAIEAIAATGGGVVQIYEQLVSFARSGGSAKDAQAILEALRQEAKTNGDEDVLSDALDYVTGFCRADLKIWP